VRKKRQPGIGRPPVFPADGPIDAGELAGWDENSTAWHPVCYKRSDVRANFFRSGASKNTEEPS
jgi:hypothetical protein